MAGEKQMHRRGKTSDGRHKASVKVKEYASGASGYKPHNTLLINPIDEPSPMWYDYGKNLAGRDSSIFDLETPLTNYECSSLAKKYRSLADEVYRVELSLINSSPGGKAGSDERWVENTMKKGTLKDRIAATSVLVSTDPIHKLSALDSLLGMAGCSDSCPSNSRVAQMAAEALEDLFLNTLLPPGRKLLNLDQRPLAMYETFSKKTLSPRLLLLWRFEEILKAKYQSFVNGYLVSTLRDGMDLNKTFALRTAGTLLRSTPEGEAQLLVMMVNKLGDPGRKIAASAAHELRRVLEEHENMQEVAAREVQQLAHRPHLSAKALYNCIVFLNQLKLRKEEINRDDSQPLSVSLVNTYFRMFDVAMKKQLDERVGMKSRLLSAILTGINRAHQFLPAKDQGLEEHTDSLYNISHTATPSASTQALMLLFHVGAGPGVLRSTELKLKQQDRYYRAVYAKLSMPSFLRGGKHLTMFFNLLYKTMKYDTDTRRVLAFAKRLLCTVAHSNASVTAASLFLLNELIKTHKHIAGCLSEIPVSDSAELSFDPSKREPRAAVVHFGTNQLHKTDIVFPLWEISLISKHFHPSVAKFATSLGVIEYSGDPLRDFTLAPFLDKFSYKNPKVNKKSNANFAQRRIGILTNEPVNDPLFLKKQNVDDTDKFYHRFFTEKARRNDVNDTSHQTDDEDNPDELFDMLDEREIDRVFDNEVPTDPEEEAFVDTLAINLMIESKHDGQADFDSEDPDTDGWNDLQDGDSLDSYTPNTQEDPDLLAVGGDIAKDIGFRSEKLYHEDEDDFMDDSDSDDDNESEGLGAYDNSSDSAYDNESKSKTLVASNGKAKRKIEDEVFADADEYEELINRAHVRRERASGANRAIKVRRTTNR